MIDAALPDEPHALKALIGQLVGELDAQGSTLERTRAELAAKQRAVGTLEQQIKALKLQIAVLRRARFGRRSERLDRDLAQLELTLEELQSARAESLSETESTQKTQRQRPARRPLPESTCRARPGHWSPNTRLAPPVAAPSSP